MNATIEDEVRAMLARRAADVPDDGEAAPPLPTGLRIAVDERPPSDRLRTRWLAAAAAIVVVLGVTGLVIRTVDDDTEQTGTTDQTTVVAPPRPDHLALLPLGVDPTIGPVRGLGRPAPTAEEASDAFMAEAFGDDVGPDQRMPEPIAPHRDGLAVTSRTPTVPLDPEAWPDLSPSPRTMSVTSRRTDAGWYVVAVANDALDLRGVRHEGDRLSGEVRATSSAPLRVVVSTVLGEVLATSDLTTSTLSGARTSVLDLDDIDVDLGGQPIVLRVEAGDRPGQIGIDDVRLAALGTVILPAPPDPEAAPGSTTEPSAASQVVSSDLPTDSRLADSMRSALPDGEDLSEVFLSTGPDLDWVGALSTAGPDGGAYSLGIYRLLPPTVLEDRVPLTLSWGRVWQVDDAPDGPDPDLGQLLYAEGNDGVVVHVGHVAPEGGAASTEELLAIAEALVADPVVAGVAAGGDPNG